ncbi:MAG TPA: nucleoside deaminase [Rhizomicrobium sp.]|jgi:tRNA(Arg) A34 adenosine deaminase TadA|nr:nucleoside deaminase [Rhizomicrobium sp.]
MSDAEYMTMALAEAVAAADRGEVPVGAVLITADGEPLARDGNRILERHDPTAHAEMLVLRAAAAKLDNERLVGTTLFVTLEPCAMCTGAMSLARVQRLVFAATDPKGGAVLHGPCFFSQPTCHHRAEISSGESADASAALLRAFFSARRV